MKKIILLLSFFFSLNAISQYDNWLQYAHGDERSFAFSVTHQDALGNYISPQCEFLFLHDSTHFELKMDTLNFSGVSTIFLPGTAGQYLRGDGSFATFPTTIIGTGLDSISGVGATVSYIITHGLGYTPDVITLSPRTPDAAGDYYISSKSTTTFTITFIVQPSIGTKNIVFDWVAVKE